MIPRALRAPSAPDLVGKARRLGNECSHCHLARRAADLTDSAGGYGFDLRTASLVGPDARQLEALRLTSIVDITAIMRRMGVRFVARLAQRRSGGCVGCADHR